MIVTKANLALFDRIRPVLEALPEGTPFDVNFAGADVAIQAPRQKNVRAIRAAFPGVTVWVKQYIETLQKWEYTTAYEGLSVLLYACAEAPPTCKAIEEEYEEEEKVPVQWETRLVTKKRVRWDCNGGAA